jgi:hypothetical protein
VPGIWGLFVAIAEHAMKFYAFMVKVPLTVPSYKKVSAAHHLKPGI